MGNLISNWATKAGFLALTLMLNACSSTQSNKPLQLSDFGKSTVDQITELHVVEVRALTREFMLKLYKRNPRELKKAKGATVEQRLEQLYQQPAQYRFSELSRKTGIDAIILAFDDTFQGDRVFALMTGLNSMLHASYGDRTKFYYFGSVDHQALYHSARNLEAIGWRLASRRDSQGKPLIYSNGISHGTGDKIGSNSNITNNLSYERLLGKMIANQDMMAKIIADRTNRTIISVAQSAASSLLIPIGI